MTLNHRFTWERRTGNHIHRYTPRCTCGWTGVHRRTIDRAQRDWAEIHMERRHLADIATGVPAELTARNDLPETLR